MTAQTKCSFCDQPFDFDNSTGSLLATCPHCGKQNTGVATAGMTQRLHILRNEPSLVRGKPCPKCRAQMAVDDMICLQCGYNLGTRKKSHGARVSTGRAGWLWLCGAALFFVVAVVAYTPCLKGKFTFPAWVIERTVSAPIKPQAEPVVAPPAGPEPATELQPAPPSEDARALFEARKAKAEEAYRQKLDEDLPLYQLADAVVLRRKDGRMVHGTLEFVGQGSNRIVIVATETGKESLPMRELDKNSRMQLDPQARENHIRDRLNIQISAPPDARSATKETRREHP